MVRGKLVNTGNSRGIRLAKPLLEVAGLADEVEIEAAPGVLTIRPSADPRAGWEKRQQHSIQKVCSMQWIAPVLTTNSGHVEQEVDGRWIAEVPELPGVLSYGDSAADAMSKAEILAPRVIADGLENGESEPLNISLSLPVMA